MWFRFDDGTPTRGQPRTSQHQWEAQCDAERDRFAEDKDAENHGDSRIDVGDHLCSRCTRLADEREQRDEGEGR